MRMACLWSDWDRLTRPLPPQPSFPRAAAIRVPEGWIIFSRWRQLLMALLTAGLLLHASRALGQPPEAPRLLPPLPSQTPPSVSEPLVQFDPTTLKLVQAENRYQLWADKKLLKDFGPLHKEAEEAVRIIRELGLSRYGTIPGAQPPFEYWLADGWATEPVAPAARGALRQVIPIDNHTLRVEQVAGVWCLRDARKVLYNFGRSKESAQSALALCKKYAFNLLGVVGNPNPLMTVLMVDPYAGPQVKQAAANPLEMADSLSRIGLVLPQVGHVGTHTMIESRRLDVLRDRDGWRLLHGADVIASFGLDEQSARAALRALQDWKVNEMARVGSTGVTLFLVNGRAPRGVPLGMTPRDFSPTQLQVQQANASWWLCESGRPILDCGGEEEGALLLKVIQFYGFDQLVRLGHPLQEGGLKLLVKRR